ncbi:hypothetical protein K435DRAFT_746713 [Dendrothele bispora CBS 962.96]|uniref:VWFA domain-containing protein n=1 Tax=Dendrothele bispora (strain CBS 962.96) TaxID=1314807 RepID=A0A4S8MNJ2_DENBC|nr:hypothetical protein K435DRAFT_746713 [Dendrothele bispora CBS 962.96]
MPLEATMMIVDNSEYMRNGDYQPSRFEAQADAVNVVFQTKIDSNPENTVGVMCMAGKGPQVLVTHSKDLGQILSAMHKTSSSIGGQIDIPTAISIAQLALKHRENKNLRQRIVVFVGSPLEGQAADEKGMIKLAKKLKKNNVAVDVVCFGDGIEERYGEGDEGKPVLSAFVESVNSGDNSHLLVVPPGPALISDALISSPILSEDRSASIPAELGGAGGTGGGAGTSGSGANDFEFGVDPSLDPELAMALRLSMQEAQAREAAETAASRPSESESVQPMAASSTTNAGGSTTKAPADPTEDEEEALLKQAIQMSTDQDVDMGVAKSSSASDSNAVTAPMDEDEDEEAAIAKAIEMSMQQQEEQGKGK